MLSKNKILIKKENFTSELTKILKIVNKEINKNLSITMFLPGLF